MYDNSIVLFMSDFESTFYSLELKKTDSLETFVNAIADWFFLKKIVQLYVLLSLPLQTEIFSNLITIENGDNS